MVGGDGWWDTYAYAPHAFTIRESIPWMSWLID